MTSPVRVLQLLVTTGMGGGPKQVFDLVRRLPKAEFDPGGRDRRGPGPRRGNLRDDPHPFLTEGMEVEVVRGP